MRLATRIDGPVAVIGDVHGQVVKLRNVMERLAARPDFADRWVVFIGDFVDRGPDPKAALDVVAELLGQHPRTTAVAGNHDLAIAAALRLVPVPESSTWQRDWLQQYDAETTFQSYGAQWGNLQDLRERLPPRHVELFAALPWLVEHPQYLFVHAGLEPHMPLEIQLAVLRQKEFSLNWPPWLCAKELVQPRVPWDCRATVVSGHDRVPAVEFHAKRILIDTTGGLGGELSCVLLPEKQVITSGAAGPPRSRRRWWNPWAR